jgi:hypothetical protein
MDRCGHDKREMLHSPAKSVVIPRPNHVVLLAAFSSLHMSMADSCETYVLSNNIISLEIYNYACSEHSVLSCFNYCMV